jgi:hypothetical protein
MRVEYTDTIYHVMDRGYPRDLAAGWLALDLPSNKTVIT